MIRGRGIVKDELRQQNGNLEVSCSRQIERSDAL